MSEQPTASRIAEAALTILVEEGADAVTMRRVATAVGITPMAIYKHFPNRQALLHSVAEAAFAAVGATWGRTEGSFEVRFEALLNDFLDFALGKPNLYGFLLTDRRTQARRFPEDFTGGNSPTFTPVYNLVKDCVRDGIMRDDDPLEVTIAITGATQGLVQLYLGGRIGLPEKNFRELCLRTVRRIFHGLEA